MDSAARVRLHIPFEKVNIGTRFQMINAVMKGALPNSDFFDKTTETLAVRLKDMKSFEIRKDWPVEIIQSGVKTFSE